MCLDFRYWGYNGHQNRGSRLPLLTRNGHEAHFSVREKLLAIAYLDVSEIGPFNELIGVTVGQ